MGRIVPVVMYGHMEHPVQVGQAEVQDDGSLIATIAPGYESYIGVANGMADILEISFAIPPSIKGCPVKRGNN